MIFFQPEGLNILEGRKGSACLQKAEWNSKVLAEFLAKYWSTRESTPDPHGEKGPWRPRTGLHPGLQLSAKDPTELWSFGGAAGHRLGGWEAGRTGKSHSWLPVSGKKRKGPASPQHGTLGRITEAAFPLVAQCRKPARATLFQLPESSKPC